MGKQSTFYLRGSIPTKPRNLRDGGLSELSSELTPTLPLSFSQLDESSQLESARACETHLGLTAK